MHVEQLHVDDRSTVSNLQPTPAWRPAAWLCLLIICLAASTSARAVLSCRTQPTAAGRTFDALVRPSPTGLFTQDAAFWQTVHMGGDGWEEQQVAAAAAAKAEWAAKVVVQDTAMHVVPGTGDRASAQVCILCF